MSKPAVAIVGAGATAVAVLKALVHFKVAKNFQLFDLVPPGLGRAFNHDDGSMICNTSPDTMSLCAWEPDDFVDYLRGQGECVEQGYFAPRRAYRDYVQHTYSQTVEQVVGAAGRVRHHPQKIKEIHRGADGRYVIYAIDGERFMSDVVVLATGVDAPFVPTVMHGLRGELDFHSDPYELIRAVHSIGTEDILIVGSKLSAIDAAVLLAKRNCKMTMVSPSGVLPAVRTATPMTSHRLIKPSDLRALDLSSSRLKERLFRLINRKMAEAGYPPLSRQISRQHIVPTRFLEEVVIAEEGRHHWQRLIVELVDGANDLLSPADDDLKSRVMAACKEVVDRYLGSVSLQNAVVIAELVRKGRLSILQGELTEIVRDEGWMVQLTGGSPKHFDRIVCATGYSAATIHALDDRILLSEACDAVGRAAIQDDLSIVLPGRDAPERIWVVGAASQSKVPLVNAMYSSVRHAQQVAGQIHKVTMQ